MTEPESDVRLAARLATGAGELLLAIQRSGAFDGDALGAEGDRVANDWLMKALRAARPDDAILSEEELDDTARCGSRRVWIIDPLDGTREFRERRDDWAVHVGLAIGGEAVVGAVAMPAIGTTFSSAAPPPPPPPPTLPHAPLRMVVSRTRPSRHARAVAEAFGAALVPMGSAGAKAMAVVRGDADIYLHCGGQYEWDNCAPAAVAQAAGLHVSRIDGSPLVYNKPDPDMPDLLICAKALAPAVLEVVRGG